MCMGLKFRNVDEQNERLYIGWDLRDLSEWGHKNLYQ